MEDVSFMKAHGEIETKVVFVDSSQRDMIAYPDPALYTIAFDEPMRSVVGVEVLDAVIPSTMYVVDEHNRDFLLYVVGITSSALHQRSVDQMSNYLKWLLNLETHALAPKHTAEASALFRGTLTVHDQRYGDVVDTHLADIPGGPDNDRIIGVRIIDSYRAGIGAPPVGVTVITLLQHTYWIPNSIGWGVERYMFDYVNGQALMIVVAKRQALSTGFPVVCQKLRFPVGNYSTMSSIITAAADGGGTDDAATTTGNPTGNAYIQSQSQNADRLLKLRINTSPWNNLLSAQRCLLAIDTTCGMSSVFGYSHHNDATGSFRAAGRTFITNQVRGALPTLLFDGPGLVNMTGERYVILRCPEVEAGMYSAGSSSGRSGTGVGLFRLSQPGILGEQRQDYITVVKRPFHPLGKIDKLTLRFERGTGAGQLYDFKGVNHLLVIAIKLLVAKRHDRVGASTLNPNYNPDYVQYLIDYRLAAREQDDRSRHDLNKLALALSKHETLTNRTDPHFTARNKDGGDDTDDDTDDTDDTDDDTDDTDDTDGGPPGDDRSRRWAKPL
jgi:hypothetical protein